jgi:hypothetical protein
MRDPKEILVPTGSTYKGLQVIKYIKPIPAHLVAGTNVLCLLLGF